MQGETSGSLDRWSVVCQTSQRSLVLYNPSLQQIRTVAQTGSAPVVPWTSPRYFQILADLLKTTAGALPLSLNDFLMNGYFDRFFPRRRLIGNGGCGSVYQVEHTLAGITLAVYAVKVIPVGEFSWLNRVISEVKLLEKLSQIPHPLIQGYKHCWIEEWQTATFGPKIPCLFILMDFAPLGNAERLLIGRGGGYHRRADDESWQIFLNIATAVHHLHTLGILHRDLKLSNVLVFAAETNHPLPIRLVLSDFGTAVDTREVTQKRSRTGATGTIETMAPELLVTDEREQYLYSHSFGSDVWSLGVILFSLFFACNPFTMAGGEERLRRFTSVDNLIQELQLGERTIPPTALRLIKKMMARDPSARCSIAEIFREPVIFEMIVRFGLDNLLDGDAPRVMVVSPSMEDFDASVPLPLPDDSDQEPLPAAPPPLPAAAPALVTKIAVGIVTMAGSFTSAAAMLVHAVCAWLAVKWYPGDEAEVLMALAMLEMVIGVTRPSVPLLAFFGYVFYVLTDGFSSFRTPARPSVQPAAKVEPTGNLVLRVSAGQPRL
jgi:serine/threonine protein kinase